MKKKSSIPIAVKKAALQNIQNNKQENNSNKIIRNKENIIESALDKKTKENKTFIVEKNERKKIIKEKTLKTYPWLKKQSFILIKNFPSHNGKVGFIVDILKKDVEEYQSIKVLCEESVLLLSINNVSAIKKLIKKD